MTKAQEIMLEKLSMSDLKILEKWTKDCLHELAEGYCNAKNDDNEDLIAEIDADMTRHNQFRKLISEELELRCQDFYNRFFEA